MHQQSSHTRRGTLPATALAALLLAVGLPGLAGARQGLSCSTFHSQKDAQAVYDANIRNGHGDRFGLDPDGDGLACEEAEDRNDAPPAAEDAPQPTPPPAARGTYSFSDPRDADIDRYWQRAFADAGLAYAPPGGLLPVGPAAFRSACIGERLDPGDTVAFYCLADRTVYYDRDVRDLIRDEYGEVAWTYVMAHEWGHHVQLLLDPWSEFRSHAPAIELQADCLAGAYIADALARDWIDEAGLDEGAALVADSGSAETHGTGAERLDAFALGVEDGPPGCGVDL